MWSILLALGLLAPLCAGDQVLKKIDDSNFLAVVQQVRPSIILLYNSEFDAKTNKQVAASFSDSVKMTSDAGEFMDFYYGNFKTLKDEFQILARQHMNEFETQLKAPFLFLSKEGHFTPILFDHYTDHEEFARIIKSISFQDRLLRYQNHSIEEELIRKSFAVVYRGSQKSPLYHRFLVTASVYSEIDFYVDERETSDQSTDVITAHKTHNVDEFTFDQHPSLLRNWVYILKYTRLLGHFTFYDQTDLLSMSARSSLPIMFLLCEMNNCHREIEMANWVIEKYRYYVVPIYAFMDKLEDDDPIVKRFATAPKPLLFMMEIKNRAYNYFLMRDNVEESYKDSLNEHHIEEFVRKYLSSYHKMVPFTLSESDSGNPFKNLEKITGQNFDDLVGKGKKHWLILVHEDHKSHQQALHNFDEWAKSNSWMFSKLGFGTYNQLINTTPIDVIKDTPLLIFINRRKIDRLKTEGVVGVPVETETDHLDLEQVHSLLKANYPSIKELKKYIEFNNLDINPNPDGYDLDTLKEDL